MCAVTFEDVVNFSVFEIASDFISYALFAQNLSVVVPIIHNDSQHGKVYIHK